MLNGGNYDVDGHDDTTDHLRPRALRALLKPGDDVRMTEGDTFRVVETDAETFVGYSLGTAVTDVQVLRYGDIESIERTTSVQRDALSVLSNAALGSLFDAVVREYDARPVERHELLSGDGQ